MSMYEAAQYLVLFYLSLIPVCLVILYAQCWKEDIDYRSIKVKDLK